MTLKSSQDPDSGYKFTNGVSGRRARHLHFQGYKVQDDRLNEMHIPDHETVIEFPDE